MSSSPVRIAVDFGASGGRVLAGRILPNSIELEEVYRFSNGGIRTGHRLLWNVLSLWQETMKGLSLAAKKYGDAIQSVGVDTWGVDYVLMDALKDFVGPCYHYRDQRTAGMLEKAFNLLPREEIFSETGIQFMEINTAYQLLAMRLENSCQLDFADRFLMMPDLFHWLLSGEMCNERTNASTTQLFNATTGDWSNKILEAFLIPPPLFSSPLEPGTKLGVIQKSVREWTGICEAEVILPPTHDTAAAVVAIPADQFAPNKPEWCYISSGTWSLMGVEVPRPYINDVCMQLNFTNEAGVSGSTRLLKNIAGLWVFQQCREQWVREGRTYDWDHLVESAAKSPPLRSLIDPDHRDFIAPANMPEAIRNYCKRTGQPVPESDAAVARCSLESLAMRYRLCLGWLEQLTGSTKKVIHIVGGGTQNKLLCQMTADVCQRRVVAGPVEATALGNVAMQAIGAGEIADVTAARAKIRQSDEIAVYEPKNGAMWEEAYQRFLRLISND
jgi:rhamnulokinase